MIALDLNRLNVFGVTRGPISFAKMDCRIKSGNDVAASGASVLSDHALKSARYSFFPRLSSRFCISAS